MSIASNQQHFNKENLTHKSRQSSMDFSIQRAFGRDLTNTQLLLQSQSDELNNPNDLEYYADEIYTYLQTLEEQYRVNFNYLSVQRDINEKMRTILIDWLVEVHMKCRLQSETLYIAINLLDRFLSKMQTDRRILQLVGITCLVLACKVQEILLPELDDFIYVTDGAYTKPQLLAMEIKILKALDYRVTTPHALNFLDRYIKVGQITQEQRNLALYILELSLIWYKMLMFSPSMVAAASILLSGRMLQKSFVWSVQLRDASKYTEGDIRDCAKYLCMMLQEVQNFENKAIVEKYKLSQYGSVADLPVFSVFSTPRSSVSSGSDMGN